MVSLFQSPDKLYSDFLAIYAASGLLAKKLVESSILLEILGWLEKYMEGVREARRFVDLAAATRVGIGLRLRLRFIDVECRTRAGLR